MNIEMRCPAVDPLTRYRCGLDKGHSGTHTAIPDTTSYWHKTKVLYGSHVIDRPLSGDISPAAAAVIRQRDDLIARLADALADANGCEQWDDADGRERVRLNAALVAEARKAAP